MEEKLTNEQLGSTQRIYFEDAYQTEFTASVIERKICEKSQALVLDKTCFYPESGGQPWDAGTIEGIEVVKVVEEDGAILHVLNGVVEASEVLGRIDWPKRFDHMQQHTGQHILSQAFFETLEGETRSFHLGPDMSTLEIGLNTVSGGELDRVEDRANEIVWEDREVKAYFVPEERIDEVPLRRPPKKQGLLRVVEVSGYDYSACGGTHCRRSGEVGMIKITGTEKIRGNLRFDFLCGSRALKDYRRKDLNIRRASTLFSTSEDQVAAQIEKLVSDFKSLKKKARKIEERVAAYEAGEVIAGAVGRVINEVFADRAPDEIRFLALNIVKSGEFAVVYGVSTETQGHLILASSPSLGFDARSLIPVVGGILSVKGGGSPTLVELVTLEKDKINEAVEAARKSAVEKLGEFPAAGA